MSAETNRAEERATEPVPDRPGRNALQARIDSLERERRRAFEDAQHEADALFAQYQLSQLVASGGTVAELGATVALELVRLAGATGGVLFLGEAGGRGMDQVAVVGRTPIEPVPIALSDLEAGRAWASRLPGGRAIVLSETQPVVALVVWPDAGAALDDDGLRVALLARHELGVAFASARLREALERERHELSAIVDGAMDLILQVDADGLVVRLNPAGERILGTTAAQAIGRPCADVLGCEVAGGHEAAACPLTQALASGVPIAYRETAVRGSSGGPVRVAGGYAATPSGGTGARATAILRDISAVKALDELREGFVATVSHELRTPLALIRGYAETLLHLELDADEQHRYLERIDEASGRLAALVDQVLDVTHLQADPLILDRAPATFASIVARLRGELDVAGGAERLVADLPADLPAVEVDVVRVGQVLSNLVGNARKYAPDGSPIVVGAAVDGPWLAVTVDDAGVGIPEEERTLVTEPFHRAWNVRESRIPGTGLGLYICRRLVEAHGGRLDVLDRPDGRVGTRVRFTLPLVGAATVTPEPADG
jgi:PAS domain S-box-containing protein